ncbi:PAS domain S-box protein [Flammeovirga yaeyamensis]|uniref:histidine kinase n=1 Tax=Flammeovirga yaeyamensis TaxID=367791 RepID=A0AAX1NBF0_9BACT|nr:MULTISPECIES: ATP-binding protein [Flammeovirga]ANQ49540.1 PAS domain S-box protein [Flammeovirga sp. MY04]MBB3697555.1 PAS domain S-box-containing protein [Flammeovirga yaeyamensis]NMF36249.1 PAS domain S-box protein [Flammeovirga yaeyamensis]QWG02978.1 PAS domain S-box protein [Flammeovirga yaeyamensis]
MFTNSNPNDFSKKDDVYLHLYETSPDMHVSVDPSTGKVIMCNKTTEEKLGKSKEDIIGTHVLDLYHPNSKDKASNIFKSFKKGSVIENERLQILDAKGHTLTVLLNVHCLTNEKGEIVCSNSSWRDISDVLTLEKEIQKNDTFLRDKQKELEEFLYIASHDLQEPLKTIQSLISLFQYEDQNQLTDNSKQYLEYISSRADSMQGIIQGLLEYSRLNKDDQLIPVDCNQIIAEIKADFQSIINEKDVKIDHSVLPTVKGFHTLIRLLFQNLINNAIKFQKENADPFIEIEAKELDDFYHFSVRDNGIGISKEYTQGIFKIFTRLHTKSEYPGHGIGLAHCRKIVNLHHGNIWVDSEIGFGSTFHFTISKSL